MSPKVFLRKHSPALLAGAAVVLFIGGVASAIAASRKVAKVLDETEQKEHQLEKTITEPAIELVESPANKAEEIVVKIQNNKIVRRMQIPEYQDLYVSAGLDIAKLYIPTLLLTAGGVACVVGSCKASAAMYAGALGMLSTANGNMESMRSKMEEYLGEKETNNVMGEMLHEKVRDRSRDELITCGEVEYTGEGDALFWDAQTGTYFYSSVRAVDDAFAKANGYLSRGKTVRLNRLMALMNRQEVPNGDDLVWEAKDGYIHYQFHGDYVPNDGSNGEGVDVILEIFNGPHRPSKKKG